MNVRELKEILNEFDENSEIYIDIKKKNIKIEEIEEVGGDIETKKVFITIKNENK